MIDVDRVVFLLLFFSICILSGPVNATDGKLVHVVRFTDYQKDSINDWLEGKGFRLKLNAQSRTYIDFKADAKGLELFAKQPAFGLLENESVNVKTFRYVEIDWGLNKQPQMISWEKGIRNQTIMVLIFLGDQRQPSGSMFIPDSPYFIGLFLCAGDDRVNYPYVGAHYQKGGRYLCTDKPPQGQMITSRFDLLNGYQTYFDKEKDDNPAISGIALEVDTSKAKDDGQSSAFIREIRFFQ